MPVVLFDRVVSEIECDKVIVNDFKGAYDATKLLIDKGRENILLLTTEDYINVGLDVGVYFGDRKELNKTHTICTWQSLNILDKRHKYGDDVLSLAEFLEGVSTVIVDEVHQAKAEVLKNLLTRNMRYAPIRWD